MYALKNLFTRNPTQISGALVAILNIFIISGAISWSSETVAAVNVALIAVLGLFVTSTTVNAAKLNDLANPPATPPAS